MSSWLQALDYWAYHFVAAVWNLYWPPFLIIAAFTLIERLFPHERNLPWRAVRFNLVWQVFALAAFVALSWSAWGSLIDWLGSVSGMPVFYLARADSAWVEAARILAVIAFNDLLLYWVHRLMHAVPALWVIHRFHHEEAHLHAATSIRQHWLNFVVVQMALLPAAWLLSADAMPAYLGYAAVTIAAFHHSNIRFGHAWLDKLIVTPPVHRIHHARIRAHYDANFSAVFPVWDMLFGTWRAPQPGEYGPTGLEHKAPSTSYWRAFAEPFHDWMHALRGAWDKKMN